MEQTGFEPVASSLRTTRSTAELPAHVLGVGIEGFIKDMMGVEKIMRPCWEGRGLKKENGAL